MERKNISLSYGIHRSPSIGADGELSECVNLIPKNGELTSVLPPKDTGIMLDEGELLLFVHNTSKYKNYIYAVGNTIKAFRITDGEREDFPFSHALENDESISHMQSIGNTLIGITNKSLQYFLFKDNTYRYLGNKGPELDMSFGLHGYLYESEEITVDISKNFLPEPADNPLFNMFTFPVEAQQQISEQLSPQDKRIYQLYQIIWEFHGVVLREVCLPDDQRLLYAIHPYTYDAEQRQVSLSAMFHAEV